MLWVGWDFSNSEVLNVVLDRPFGSGTLGRLGLRHGPGRRRRRRAVGGDVELRRLVGAALLCLVEVLPHRLWSLLLLLAVLVLLVLRLLGRCACHCRHTIDDASIQITRQQSTMEEGCNRI